MSNTIKVGGTTIDGSIIQSGKTYTTHAMVGETLSVDQMTLDINNDAYPLIPADQDGPLITADNRAVFCTPIDISTLKTGAEFYCYDAGELIGKFWVDKLKHMGGGRYRITALSIIGQFLNSRHMGGMYETVPASVVYAELLQGVRYVLDPDVAAATVKGYLPLVQHRRDNLQQLLMVTGATLRVDDTGTLYISAMSSTSAGTFGPSRTYIGGSVTEETPVAGVRLTEHNYFKAGNTVVLFEDGIDGEELIEFREPYHSLACTGGTIVESGVNYARIRATGTVTLTGQPYTHVTRVVSAGTVSGAAAANVRSVSQCTLANPQIAQALAERVYKFLQCSRTIKTDVLFGSERAGDVVSIFNPYTRTQETGTIRSLNLTLSGVNKANVECLMGFVPSGVISGFTNHALLTGSGSWTVPAGVYKIRIILVGAGTGGGGGNRGADGTDSTQSNNYEPGTGGAGGSPGAAGPGGKVFEISLDVTPGQVFNFSCGVGGIGGAGQTAAAAAVAGTAGTPTTFGGYSSDYGRLYPYGYYEPKTGLTVVTAGAAGMTGGRGGNGTDEDWEWETNPKEGTAVRAESGESVNGYPGGAGAKYTEEIIGERNEYWRTGAGGGGASNGNAGGAANRATGGNGAVGGAGANSVNFGQGGGAGNGGGGGGGAGTVYNWYVLGTSRSYNAYGGDGGDGGQGGSGGPGAIIVYY